MQWSSTGGAAPKKFGNKNLDKPTRIEASSFLKGFIKTRKKKHRNRPSWASKGRAHPLTGTGGLVEGPQLEAGVVLVARLVQTLPVAVARVPALAALLLVGKRHGVATSASVTIFFCRCRCMGVCVCVCVIVRFRFAFTLFFFNTHSRTRWRGSRPALDVGGVGRETIVFCFLVSRFVAFSLEWTRLIVDTVGLPVRNVLLLFFCDKKELSSHL